MRESILAQMLSLAALAAQIILENGAETYRVEDTVQRLCRSFGFDDVDVIALSTGVVISITADGDSQSIVRRVRKRGMNLARVNAVNDLSRQVASAAEQLKIERHKGTPEEIPTAGPSMLQTMELLRSIQSGPTAGPLRQSMLAGLAAGSFALMFGGGLPSMVTALVCGIVAHWLTWVVRKADISLVLTSLVGGVVCATLTMGAYYLFPLSPDAVEAALAGAIMPLISGLMMTNAVRDTLRGDLLSGMARGLEALLVAVMVALGISLMLRFYLPGNVDMPASLPPWWLGIGAAGFATLFFCPLLHVPARAVVPASLLGAVAYGAYLLLEGIVGAGEIMSLFIASAAVAVLCDLLARRMRMITTIFLCVALIPLVPGLGLYRTMYALLMREFMPALAIGLQTLFAVGAIALGAALGSLRSAAPERRRHRIR